MKMRFQTKEESNRLQEEEFLKRSPSERAWCFFSLAEQIKRFPTKYPPDKSPNFTIVIQTKKTGPKRGAS